MIRIGCFLIFATWVLASFASDMDPLENQNINGVWDLKSMDCETGRLTDTGQNVYRAVKDGRVEAIARFKNSLAVVDSRSWANSEKKGGFCRSVAQQRWNLIGSGSLTSDQIIVDRSGSHCGGGRSKYKEQTVSNFIVLGDTLKLYLQESVDFRTGILRKSGHTCTTGPVTLTFERSNLAE
ncbi:MAG: hypothetical protein KDD43_15525 [Bdellovibrionales bacterium]|nr:hypothetical protein [Bdellovibrionales bacterium]